jgi:hypothetical protein
MGRVQPRTWDFAAFAGWALAFKHQLRRKRSGNSTRIPQLDFLAERRAKPFRSKVDVILPLSRHRLAVLWWRVQADCN